MVEFEHAVRDLFYGEEAVEDHCPSLKSNAV